MKTTPQERLALTVVTLLLVGGAGARAFRGAMDNTAAFTGPAVEASPLNTVKDAVDREAASKKPLTHGERIDVNQATPDELRRLPEVGAKLAEAIVAHRKRGAFRTLADLDEVPGMGPATLEAVKDHVTFGAAPSSDLRSPAQRPRPLHSATPPGAGGRVDLNRATAKELEALPGIGPSLARAIVEDRRENGPFRGVRDLERVSGIGPATARKLAPLVSP